MKKPFKRAEPLAYPAIVMLDPRYPHNVGAAVRACSCFGTKQVWLTGKRVAEEVWDAKRLPREERMKGFADVSLILEDRPFDHFDRDAVPVAIELLPNSENLFQFEHPEKAVYVFGPEDGSIPGSARARCHRRIFIPTKHCTNLAAAVYLVLYDRLFKEHLAGNLDLGRIQDIVNEPRGWPADPKLSEWETTT
jgi:tRNA(Leu) C34 or U34 (ribose-2'-O)-methylase TrmL